MWPVLESQPRRSNYDRKFDPNTRLAYKQPGNLGPFRKIVSVFSGHLARYVSTSCRMPGWVTCNAENMERYYVILEVSFAVVINE